MGSVEADVSFSARAFRLYSCKQLLAVKFQEKVSLTHTERYDQAGVPWLGIYYGLKVKYPP